MENIVEIINSSQIHTFIGSSGSGKTANLNNINKSILKKTKVSYCIQKSIFLFNTVYDELDFSLSKKYKRRKQRIIDSLLLMGMNESYLMRTIESLTLSEQKRLQLVICLINNPKVIILDDPTLYLDSKEKKELVKLLKRLKRKYNKTIIIATRDLSFCLEVSDYIYLYKHEIIFKGNKKEVMDNNKLFSEEGLALPKTILFSNIVKDKKNISIGYRMEIDDLIKDIYRYAK